MKTEQHFVQLTFAASPRQEEIQGILSAYSPSGIVEEESEWTCCFTLEEWNKNESTIRESLRAVFADCMFSIERIAPQNWNATWEATIQPIRVGERFVIHPSWHRVDSEAGVIPIIVDPKMSFGTGYHATTRLMIRSIEQIDLNGKRVLDVGTGTGILAIAAVKAGAAFALGIDNDEWSYENSMENVRLNGVESRVEIALGSMEVVAGEFDCIIANITKNDIVQLLGDILVHTHRGSSLLFSGILAVDETAMIDAFTKSNLTVAHTLTEEEWIAFICTKSS